MGLTVLIKEAKKHSERAAEAMRSGHPEAAENEMKLLSEAFETYNDESTDEAPEEQKDDAEDNDSVDDKGCVGDKPHTGHCVPS